ncbi:glutamate synthase large subunit [Lysinibacillus endophyticus]|uniref:glutamate synthase large subunit n=1 Tax=Ureibacillus endophyticus TaxID=1978490 RepID=UPI00209EDD46|nr:glutamate synthase large subunit [Lysinibacillus endophyticus]MCP1145724.1 glutamate synthase large subunit [Lysinibacillus endophyticus]
MSFHQLPDAQGLYSPSFEHDACGIGFYANIKGRPSHNIVKNGLEMLCRLEHRAGRGGDGKTGDGAGLMVQIPDAFFRLKCPELELPAKGDYGVGQFFFSENVEEREAIEQRINELIESEGQVLIGWRTAPTNKKLLSDIAKSTAPVVRQVFIKKNENIENSLDFERKLYLIRKQAEFWAKQNNYKFYCPSLSSQTMVFKGLLTPEEVSEFYVDLQDDSFISAFSIVHSRYSTNTFPSWERAHPNRYIVHNGEINTLRGNINWMTAREQQFVSEAFGEDLQKLLPIIDHSGSDSSMLDNAFEFFVLAGRTPAHTAMMLIPEPWTENPHISKEKKAFYSYHASLMEPWDGPTAVCFTDGKQIGSILDRNGLRPARYYVTKDDMIVFSSEVGVVDIEEEEVLYKERLSPGRMLLIDLEQGKIISDEELKSTMAAAEPYAEWLEENLVTLEETEEAPKKLDQLTLRQKTFGYTYEDLHKYIVPIASSGKDPIGSMGTDTPLAVLSDRPQSLFNYFKQLFAQVTNPPIDSIREHIVTSTMTLLGAEGNLLHPNAENARRIFLETPILTNDELQQLVTLKNNHFKSTTLTLEFKQSLKDELDRLFKEAEAAIDQGVSLLILSDELQDISTPTIPVLLAVSGLHQHLIRVGKRTKVSLIVNSGEAREVHHFASLIGFGADAINPYLAYASVEEAIESGHITISYQDAVKKYRKGIAEGVVKVMSKMGISTVQSYRGAQIFEAVGISKDVIDQYFTGTASQIDGINLETIGEEAKRRHEAAFTQNSQYLESGSEHQWRANGEHHAFNPKTIHTLQTATRKNDYGIYRMYAEMANEERIGFLRNLFEFKTTNSIPLEEVESVDSIVKRFKTGAMSFGSISKEAHETLAIAMNRLGGRSNSGEGGEHSSRYEVDANGDNRNSAIKQIASGRFGVKSHYLVNAQELQIKMAQGAKPGEGGQLPGNKVYPWVAEVRGSTPGVGLISPPPHHDIYSIEDLAELIYDLKNANRHARISVKLVAKAGVGTIAAGVAKGGADVIVISGYDGGTGASPKTSIKHTGLPWELGLAEAHQTLMLNGLRERVTLETDGKLMTGKDVVMAALLGAEEFGFATAPLIVLGCIMMRACHLDTCPVGVATQNPELRAKFMGNADHIVNFMRFIAEEMREYMAKLGFRTVDEMVGRTDVLQVSDRAKSHWKASQLNLSSLLYQVEGVRTKQRSQDLQIEETFDLSVLLPKVENSIRDKERIELEYEIKNTDRVMGTIIGSEISKKYGEKGLTDETITLKFTGHAGQSFGAFAPRGLTLSCVGDVNDYFGKGLSGGKLVAIAPIKGEQEKNVIAGNVCLYGATSGTAYINGRAGDRFAVRNSGANIVVEGIGDHGCEYMTGGRVVILGDAGKNFAAGMSGGIAYVLPTDENAFKENCNTEMVEFEQLSDKSEIEAVRSMIIKHLEHTESSLALDILAKWDSFVPKFIKVVPTDYKVMLEKIEYHKFQGLEESEAAMQAFVDQTSGKELAITNR